MKTDWCSTVLFIGSDFPDFPVFIQANIYLSSIGFKYLNVLHSLNNQARLRVIKIGNNKAVKFDNSVFPCVN